MRKPWAAAFAAGVTLALSGMVSAEAGERFPIPFKAFAVHVPVEGRDVQMTITGTASAADLGNALDVQAEIVVSLADLRAQLGAIVQAKMNRDDDCNEKLQVHTVDLHADPPTATLSAAAHYEKWVCALGGKAKLFEQNGEVRVAVAPVADGDTIRANFTVLRVDADGALGGLLRDKIFGTWILDQIRPIFPKTVTVARLRDALPPALHDIPATLTDVSMIDIGNGTPAIRGTLRMTIPADKVLAILTELQK